MTHEVLVDALVATTGLGIVVWAASVIARRSSASLRHTLWRIALAGFWLVPAILVAATVLDLDAYAIRVPVLSTVQFTQPVEPAGPQGSGPFPLGVPSSAAATSLQTEPQQAVTARPIDVANWLLLLWVVGAAFGGACFVRNMYSVRRLLSQSSPADDPILTARASHWAAKIGLEKVPALAESETVVVPTVAGWRTPVILLPSGFSVSDGGSDAIIVHELAHVHRGDVATVWLARFTRTLWWWHPLVWLIAHKLRSSAEEACDNWAIALTERRKAYAGVLVHWAEVGASASNLACAYQGKALVRRVKRILTERRIPMLQLSGRMKAVLAVCAFCAIVAAGTLRVAPTQAESSAVTAQTEAVNTVTITGQVLGPEGQPVSDCRVLALCTNVWDRLSEVVTDAAGQFQLKVSTPRDLAFEREYKVIAIKEGYALAWSTAQPELPVTVTLGANPITCAGTVTDRQGQPIAGAKVSLGHMSVPQDAQSRSYVTFATSGALTCVTDEAGLFEFPGLPADATILLLVSAEGKVLLRHPQQIPADSKDIKFVLQPAASISGRLTREGQPVPDVTIAAEGGGSFATRQSGADGIYIFKHLRHGTFNVMVDAPEGYTAVAATDIRLDVGQHFTGVDLELIRGGLVHGTLTHAETSEPVADVYVSARGPARPEGGGYDQWAETDEAGHYSLRLPPGNNTISPRHYTKNFSRVRVEPRYRRVEVAEGETLSGVDFILSPQSEVKGQVLGPGGQSVADAQVIVWYPVPGYGWKPAHGWSDDAGHFSIRIDIADLTDRVNVGAMKPGLGVQWNSVLHSEAVRIELGVDTASCTGVITDPAGEPIASARITVGVLNREGVEFPATWFLLGDELDYSVTTAEGGKFEIAGLPADSRVSVMIAADGYARLRPPVDDPWPAGSRDLRVVLQPEATISGRVTRDGKPVSGVEVFCQSGERTVTHGRTTTVSAKDGSYKLRGLSAATYAVMVNAPEGFTAVAVDGVALKAGEHFTGANLELITGGVIRGTVREAATGKPVPAASIGVSGPARPWSSGAQSVASNKNGIYIVRLPAGRSRFYYVGNAVGFPHDLADPQVGWVEVVDGQTVNGPDFVLRRAAGPPTQISPD